MTGEAGTAETQYAAIRPAFHNPEAMAQFSLHPAHPALQLDIMRARPLSVDPACHFRRIEPFHERVDVAFAPCPQDKPIRFKVEFSHSAAAPRAAHDR
jgi:hypothetical protein